MCEREQSDAIPTGGLLCDVMGLGKTVTTLATIMDGRRNDRNELRAPTLIIVPSQLKGHWQVFPQHLFAIGLTNWRMKGISDQQAFQQDRIGLCHPLRY